MLKKILSLLLLVLIFGLNVYAQDNNGLSSGRAPYVRVQYPANLLTPAGPDAYNSRAFAYNAYGGTLALGPFKMWLNGTGMTSLFTDPLSAEFVQAGSFCGADGFWYGIRYETAPPNKLVKIDTSTGVITQIALVSGAGSITGLAWDCSTNTMYALNYVASASNVGTINLTTGAYTPLAGTLTTGLPIDMAISNNGSIYANVITAPTTPTQIYSVNKSTGAWTALPQTSGYNGNYAQGMSWDHSVDTGYLAAYNYTNSNGELRKIDISTGATTLIATLVSEVDGMAIPGAPGPTIMHTPLPNTQNLTGPYIVNCQVIPQGSAITSSKTFWSRNNTVLTDSITMTNSSGNNWTGNIPGNGAAATYRYQIKAWDALGRVGMTSVNTFLVVAIDTTKPVITHIPLENCPKLAWPDSVKCSITNPFGIDSAWVRWTNTRSGITKRFNLANLGGTNWGNPFNSNQSEVLYNDSIVYRIIARNASTQHNMDSTAQYSFKIVSLATACIGTGTVAMGSASGPFNTYWYGNRTNLLYTAAEILANSGAAGSITRIGFQISVAAPQPMSGFNIRMQNTTNTTLTGFTSTGWTTVYSGTYTVPGTGWQYIDLQTPYVWNGTSNILIEICFGNTSYTTATTVLGTTMTAMETTEYHDLSTACAYTGFITPVVQTARANTCFVINTLVGVNNNTSLIPNVYSLSQNYPNPFNPVTQIRYGIPKQGLVTMNVYDVLGREVTKLVNEVKAPGSYLVDFDGSNLSSGVYFYKLSVGSFSDVKRMVLIK